MIFNRKLLQIVMGVILTGCIYSPAVIHNVVGIDVSSVQPVLVIGGTQGTGHSQFNEPDSVYVDASGRIYAGDTKNLRVQIFSPDGVYLSEITEGFTPLADASGNEAQGLAELSNGTLVVVEKAGNLFAFNKDTGALTGKIDLKALMTASQWDTQGLVVDTTTDNVYITNQPEQTIMIVNANGTLVNSIVLEASATPENMALDKGRDRIFVSAEGLKRIDYLSFNGTEIGYFGEAEATGNYEGLALDPLGNILAVNEGPDSATSKILSSIVIFDHSNYSAVYQWGGTDHTAEGEFLSPDGIAYDFYKNQVIIADQGNFRLQVFDYIDILKTSGIYDDTTAPTVSAPTDVTFATGSDQTISWTISDNSPFGGSYTILIDGSNPQAGRFGKDSSDVTLGLSSLSVGTHGLQIDVVDAFGNTATDKVSVIVNDVPTSSTPTSEKSNSSSSPFDPSLAILTFIAIPILKKKKLL